MKLYRARIPAIATAVITRLSDDGDIEVEATDRGEAGSDLVAIMEMYLRRDNELRDAVRNEMERKNIPYDQYGKIKGELAEQWAHPTGNEVNHYFAKQFMENFMISKFIGEVFTDDRVLYQKIKQILIEYDVDEKALLKEAEEKIKNVKEGSVERQDALARALKEVRKRHGLLTRD